MLGLKLNHASKMGPSYHHGVIRYQLSMFLFQKPLVCVIDVLWYLLVGVPSSFASFSSASVSSLLSAMSFTLYLCAAKNSSSLMEKSPQRAILEGAGGISRVSPACITRAIPSRAWYSIWQCINQKPVKPRTHIDQLFKKIIKYHKHVR